MDKGFCKLIGLNEQAIQVCESYSFSQGELLRLYEDLKKDRQLFLQRENEHENPQARLLAMYVNFAFLAKKQYESSLIPMQIFYETFADIALWENEYFNQAGSHGIAETEWLAHHLLMELFRIGSLQFEITQKLPANLPESAKKFKALQVHIPKGADLSSDAVEQSFKMALQFFKTEAVLFLCSSWLLSPELNGLLPQGSRILQFASNFKILSTDSESCQAQERIFGKVCDNPADYPAQTSLQTAAKKHLLSGGKIPSAQGYFIKN